MSSKYEYDGVLEAQSSKIVEIMETFDDLLNDEGVTDFEQCSFKRARKLLSEANDVIELLRQL